MNIIVTGYLKQNLPTESRKQFSGILITKNGGKQLFQENTGSNIHLQILQKESFKTAQSYLCYIKKVKGSMHLTLLNLKYQNEFII